MFQDTIHLILATAGLAVAALALIYACYGLLRVLLLTIRLSARLEALWMLPLWLLGLDAWFRSHTGQKLVEERARWVWRSVLAGMICVMAAVIW